MAAKRERFIVLIFSDRDEYGFDEHTLPPLVALMDSAQPDHRQFIHWWVTGYFLTSRHALSRIQIIIEQAERLRAGDSRFSTLSIGLAEGPMIADFTWLGGVKSDMPPLGTVSNHASLSARTLDAYKQPLQKLLDKFNHDA